MPCKQRSSSERFYLKDDLLSSDFAAKHVGQGIRQRQIMSFPSEFYRARRSRRGFRGKQRRTIEKFFVKFTDVNAITAKTPSSVSVSRQHRICGRDSRVKSVFHERTWVKEWI
ncbi:hypothetical protein SLE2022_382920 [Rubroshorea leprosula]